MEVPSREVGRARAADCADTALLLVPVGALEQHGPHLPLGTDTAVATTVAGRTGLPVTPPIALGASGEHEGFPGTISIGTETLAAVLVETGRSACRWARRLCFVNGHGGNLPALVAATTLLRAEGRDVAWHSCGVPGADAHAGRHETSLMLALAPDDVRADLAAAGNTAPLGELMPAIRAGSVAAVSANGVLGDPAGATAAEGAETTSVMVSALLDALRDWRVDDHGRLGA
ncbi:mycofactocin biosynthesis peptidyl-dipeptidase MftE [Actinomycetospora sp. TBRC 11914]|uniref:mycofactocin biosynthesis peptidyl-dipeptidase MftE n=1 Tax=Actinomycetospora sp. TBRC 11914 TaxID=2729387 RepID=UPI00145F15E8|nr:mycofactocin biosynthesis peptidyl-dipeptidase MftE [Actinomycetospora sp. TBRC 11914]NMO88965.1 mycofactocin biosynthesis peptidyl-dipeptidase MftE [Actinomycetospora sp. TBRC 11914]